MVDQLLQRGWGRGSVSKEVLRVDFNRINNVTNEYIGNEEGGGWVVVMVEMGGFYISCTFVPIKNGTN